MDSQEHIIAMRRSLTGAGGAALLAMSIRKLTREQHRVTSALYALSAQGWTTRPVPAVKAQGQAPRLQQCGRELDWQPWKVAGHLLDCAHLFTARIDALKTASYPLMIDLRTTDSKRFQDYRQYPAQDLLSELLRAQRHLRNTLATVRTHELGHRGRHRLHGEIHLSEVVRFLPGHDRDHAEQLLSLGAPTRTMAATPS